MCSWSTLLCLKCPTEPVLVEFSTELTSCPCPLVLGWRQPAISPAIYRLHVGVFNLQQLITVQVPREMKNMFLSLPAASTVCYTHPSLCGYSDKYEQQT